MSLDDAYPQGRRKSSAATVPAFLLWLLLSITGVLLLISGTPLRAPHLRRSPHSPVTRTPSSRAVGCADSNLHFSMFANLEINPSYNGLRYRSRAG